MRSQERDLSPQALTSIYDHVHSQLIETRSLYRQLPLHQRNKFKHEMGRLIHSTSLAKAAVKRVQGFKSTPEKRYELRRHLRDLAKRILNLKEIFRAELGIPKSPINKFGKFTKAGGSPAASTNSEGNDQVSGSAKADLYKSMSGVRRIYSDLQKQVFSFRRKIQDREALRKLNRLLNRVVKLVKTMETIVKQAHIENAPNKVRLSSLQDYNNYVGKLNSRLRDIQTMTGIKTEHVQPVLTSVTGQVGAASKETTSFVLAQLGGRKNKGKNKEVVAQPQSPKKPKQAPNRKGKPNKKNRKRKNEMRTQLLAYLVDKENDLTVRYQEWGTSQKKTHTAPPGEVAIARKLGVQLMNIKRLINGFGGDSRKMKGNNVKTILALLQKAEFRMRVLEHKSLARGITPSNSKNVINTPYLVEVIRKQIDLRSRLRALLPNLKTTKVNVTKNDKDDVKKIQDILTESTKALRKITSPTSGYLPVIQDLVTVEGQLNNGDMMLKNLEHLNDVAIDRARGTEIKLVKIRMPKQKPLTYLPFLPIEIPLVPSVSTLTPSQAKQFAYEVAKAIEKYKNYISTIEDGSRYLRTLDDIAKNVMLLEESSSDVTFRPDEIGHLMHIIRDSCVAIQDSLHKFDVKRQRETHRLMEELNAPVLKNIQILQNATRDVITGSRHKLGEGALKRLENILKALKSLRYAVINDDIDFATTNMLIARLEKSIGRLRSMHTKRQAHIVKMRTYLNQLGARLETLHKANENSRYRERFRDMLKYLTMDYKDIVRTFKNKKDLRTMNLQTVEKEMEFLSDRMERIEALLIDKAMAPQACNKRYCSSHGVCEITKAGYHCTCHENFLGNRCEYEVAQCPGKICHNGGRCVSVEGFVRCLCPPQFTGTLCQEKTHACKSSPCLHGGTCIGKSDPTVK